MDPVSAAIHHGLSLPSGSVAGIKGGWLGLVSSYPSEMAQNFWTAIWAWSTCFLVTILISFVTKPKTVAELQGLVYAHTKIQTDGNPMKMALVILACLVVLNVIFW